MSLGPAELSFHREFYSSPFDSTSSASGCRWKRPSESGTPSQAHRDRPLLLGMFTCTDSSPAALNSPRPVSTRVTFHLLFHHHTPLSVMGPVSTSTVTQPVVLWMPQ